MASKFQSSQQQKLAPASEEHNAFHGPAQGSRFDKGGNVPSLDLAQKSYQSTTELQTTDLYPRGCEPHSSTNAEVFELSSTGPIDLNPYLHRADEIGPTHRIPGLGHLGDLLVPPGWKEGDEPIKPQEAQELYNQARKEAQDGLEKTNEDMDMSPKEEQDKRSEERDNEWSKRFKKDDLILRERIKIYDEYKESKYVRKGQLNVKLPGPFPSPGLLPLRTMQPPASTSVPQYTETLAPLNFPHRSRSAFGLQSVEYGE